MSAESAVTDFTCALTAPSVPFPHYWEHTVGSGHAVHALRADWQRQLRRCHEELGFEHVRFHGLLSDEMGTVVCQDEQLLFSFFNIDQIFDFLLGIGMRPFVELSFMPEALASGHTTVFRYRGNVTPPAKPEQWTELIRRLTEHWVARYGAPEVRRWLFEVWNEPNLSTFWTGSQDDYFAFYAGTAAAIKGVDSSLRVGGPATANSQWIDAFLTHCRDRGVGADFVTTHQYPTDAFGTPGADTITQLEHAPRGGMADQARQARQAAGALPLYYTEWNISSNPRDPLHDQPFAAAFVTQLLMDTRGVVDGYSFWTFTDIFSENYFPSIPFHGGFGLLTLHGIAKPAYRAFELLHQTGTELVAVEGTHPTADVWVIRHAHHITVLMTNLAMPRHPIDCVPLTIRLAEAPPPHAVWVERIDEDHCNPRRVWEAMGSPTSLSAGQVTVLHAASALERTAQPWHYEQGALTLDIVLPPQSVAAITIALD